MTEPREIVLVGCGSAKQEDRHAARNLYSSQYFRLKRRYAEIRGSAWRILSARHHLLHPETRITPYDRTLTELESEQRRDWAATVYSQLQHRIVDRVVGDAVLTVLAGSAYREPLLDHIEDRGLDLPIRNPFDGTSGIGEQMQWLKQEIAAEQQSVAEAMDQ